MDQLAADIAADVQFDAEVGNDDEGSIFAEELEMQKALFKEQGALAKQKLAPTIVLTKYGFAAKRTAGYHYWTPDSCPPSS